MSMTLQNVAKAFRSGPSRSVRLDHAFLFSAAVLTAVAWFPQFSLVPAPSADQSWRAGLVMARSARLQFGPDLVFTYGPLGFLAHPTLWGGPSILAIAVATIFLLVQVQLLAKWLSFRVPTLVAAVAAAIFVRSTWTYEQSTATPLALLLFGASVAVLVQGKEVPLTWCLLAGGAGGVILLIKVDLAAPIFLALVGTVAAGWPKLSTVATKLLCAVLALVGSLVSGWVLLGQSLYNLPIWLRSSLEITRGFNEYGVFRAAPFTPAAAIAMTLAVVGLVAFELSTLPLSKRSKWFVAVLLATGAWIFAKSGFVRYDGHAYRYVWFLSVVTLAVWGGPRSTTLQNPIPASGTRRLISVSLLLAVFGVSVAMTHIPGGIATFASPWKGPTRLARAVHPIASKPARTRITKAGTAAILNWAGLSPEEASLLKQRKVHAEAEDISVLWALGKEVDWTPNPVFQSYAAYTVRLDNLNADGYRDVANGPDALVYLSQPGDGHHPRFQSPAALVAMFCNFQPHPQLGVRFQVFTRVKNRCGPPESRKRVEGVLGAPLLWSMPTPAISGQDWIVVGSFDLERGKVEELNSLVRLRPRTWTFQLGPEDGGTRYRFDPATAQSAHILEMPRCLHEQVPQFDMRKYNPITIAQNENAPRIPVTLTVTRIPFECPAA